MIPFQKKGRVLPVVLSQDEVAGMLDGTENLKHKALQMTLYSGGLRLTEARKLQIADIDSKRMTIRVQGKGKRERYVMLSARLLEMLREYYRAEKVKPKTWLFPGAKADAPFSDRSIQKIVKAAAKRAGIRKKVSTHCLRHSFGTHLLENGTNIRVIQQLLGHKSLNSTMIYTHVAKNGHVKTKSPLDELKKKRKKKG